MNFLTPQAAFIGLSLAFVVISAVLFVYQKKQLALREKSKAWPTAEATITSASTDKRQNSDNSITHIANLTYAYRVGNRDYQSDRIVFGGNLEGTLQEVTAFMESHAVGTKGPVYYDPKDPANAILNPQDTGNLMLLLLLAFFIGALGIVGVFVPFFIG
jgi:hypothetical protein